MAEQKTAEFETFLEKARVDKEQYRIAVEECMQMKQEKVQLLQKVAAQNLLDNAKKMQTLHEADDAKTTDGKEKLDQENFEDDLDEEHSQAVARLEEDNSPEEDGVAPVEVDGLQQHLA